MGGTDSSGHGTASGAGDAARGTGGFTLVELVVVVAVIAILLGVATATFRASREQASDRAAQALAKRAVATHQVHGADATSVPADAARLDALEPSIDFRAWPAHGAIVQGRVYVRDAADDVVTLVVKSATGRCFWAKDAGGVTLHLENDCSVPRPSDLFRPSW